MRLPLLLLFCIAARSPAATLTGPASLADANPVPIRITGLAPGSALTLVVEQHAAWAGGGQRSKTSFTAAPDGSIDTSRDAPISGSYTDVSASGPFWSMRPTSTAVANKEGTARLLATTSRGETLMLSVPALPTAVTQRAIPDFSGAVLARPVGVKDPLPVVIVLGGSEGGAFAAKTYAPMLAAHGFAVLGLPYYSPGYDPGDTVPGLPTSFSEIPADRLIAVKAWIDRQRDLDSRRIAIWGVSKGGEFAVLAASRLPWITAIVGVVPSDVVWEGWGRAGPATSSFSWDGKPLPYVPYLGFDLELARLQRGERMEARRPHIAGRAAYPERIAAATIKVEDYAGQMLLIGGDDDRVWPSGPMARAIADRRAAAGRATAVLTWPNAGHALAGPGTEPVAVMLLNGGTAAGLAAARRTAWAATIAFLKRNLMPKSAR